MKQLKNCGWICILFCFLNVLYADEGYWTEFGTEFLSGYEEQSDDIGDSLNSYYSYAKNITYFKRTLDYTSDIKLQTDIGFKDYTDTKLDNRFHIVKANYITKLSAIFALDMGLQYGEVVNQTDDFNSYIITNLEPKLIADIYTWQLYTSYGYQIKDFENRKEINTDLVDTTKAIIGHSFKLGLYKQITFNSYLRLDYVLKNLTQDNFDKKDYKTTQNVKVGYYWKR